jgi:hypothetical protein
MASDDRSRGYVTAMHRSSNGTLTTLGDTVEMEEIPPGFVLDPVRRVWRSWPNRRTS